MLRNWYSKLQHYCFRFVFSCNAYKQAYGDFVDLIVQTASLQSLIYLYLNHRINNMLDTPLMSLFIKTQNYLQITELDSTLLELTALMYWIVLSIPIVIVILTAILVVYPIKGASLVVTCYLTSIPIFYSKVIPLFFYTDNTAFCAIFKSLSLVCTSMLFSIHMLTHSQSRRLPEMTSTLLLTVYPSYILPILAILAICNLFLYYPSRSHPQHFFRCFYPPVLLMYSIHTHLGYINQINDIQLVVALAFSVLIQVMLGLRWVKDKRRERVAEEECLENTMQLVGVVIGHYSGCLGQELCECEDQRTRVCDKGFVSDIRVVREVVLKLQKCEKQVTMQTFDQNVDFAEFMIEQMNYALKGVVVLCKIIPKSCYERYRLYCLGEKYKNSLFEGIKIRNERNSQEIERTYHDYEKYRSEMGKFIKRLIEFYKNVKSQTVLNVSLFDNIANGLSYLESIRRTILQYHPSVDYIKYIYNVFLEFILNEKVKLDLARDIVIDPYAVFRKNTLVRCNEEFEKLIGTSKASMMCRRIQSFMPVPFQRFHQDWIDHYLETSVTSSPKFSPTKWVVCETGFIVQTKALVNIIPNFEQGLELICVLQRTQNKKTLLWDSESEKIVGFTEDLFRCFYDRKMTKSQYSNCLADIKVDEMMPFLKDSAVGKKIHLATTDKIFQQKSIHLELPLSEVKYRSCKIANVKIVQIDFAVKTLTLETSGQKTLVIPKTNNCMHPQLSVSSIFRPYYLLLLPFALRILYYYFFDLTLPFLHVIDSTKEFLDLSVCSSLHIIQLENGINITALPEITSLQESVFGYIKMSEQFLDVITFNNMGLARSAKPESYALEKLREFQRNWSNSIRWDSKIAQDEQIGVAFILVLFGFIYAHTAYKILETRRMKKLICQGFTVLKCHQLQKIIFKLENLYEYFEQFSSVTNPQLDEDIAQCTISTLPVHKDDDPYEPPKSLLQKAQDIVVKLLISITFDSEKIEPKRLDYNCRHLYWHLWVLAFFVLIATGIHLGGVLILCKFQRELSSIFDSYQKTQNLLPSLKLRVSSCFTDKFQCQSSLLDQLSEDSKLILALPSEFNTYKTTHTNLISSPNLCGIFRPTPRYPNLTISSCLASNAGIYNSSFDQSALHFVDLLRTAQTINRSSVAFTRLVSIIIQEIAYLEPVLTNLKAVFLGDFDVFQDKRAMIWIIVEIMSFLSIAIMLLVMKTIFLVIQKKEEASLMLMKTIERSMFDTNLELKIKFSNYLPS